MVKRSIAIVLALAMGSEAVAALNLGIELIPQTPGPYDTTFGAIENLILDVRLTQTGGIDIPIRSLTFDFAQTDPPLIINGYEWDYLNGLGCPIIPDLCGGMNHVEFVFVGGASTVTTVFTGTSPDLFTQLVLPGDSGLIVGHLDMTVPANTPFGEYVVDAINVEASNVNMGARLDYGFAFPQMIWGLEAFDGGATTLTVIPEPATLALLAFGGVAFLCNRKPKNASL